MKQLCLEADVSNISRITDYINDYLDTFMCPVKIQTQIDIAVDELFGNIAKYAYKGGKGEVTVIIDIINDPSTVKITFIDSGIRYNPLAKEDPNIGISADDRKVGGLGIYMVKKIMDDVIYEYNNGKNILTIVKGFGIT